MGSPISGESMRQTPTSPVGFLPSKSASINTPTPETEISAAGKFNSLPPMCRMTWPFRRLRGERLRSLKAGSQNRFKYADSPTACVRLPVCQHVTHLHQNAPADSPLYSFTFPFQ